jgi:hypothetical protein
MQVRLLSAEEPTKQYAVIFYTGDEAFFGLLEFAEKYHGHVLAAYVSPTLEVMVTVDPLAMQKRFDP